MQDEIIKVRAEITKIMRRKNNRKSSVKLNISTLINNNRSLRRSLKQIGI